MKVDDEKLKETILTSGQKKSTVEGNEEGSKHCLHALRKTIAKEYKKGTI